MSQLFSGKDILRCALLLDGHLRCAETVFLE